VHGRPFNVSMNVPKDSYKYSTAGLSHKFINPKILQSCDLEEKIDHRQEVIRFKEFRELNEGDIFVFIEY
jgi:hypothetical protein